MLHVQALLSPRHPLPATPSSRRLYLPPSLLRASFLCTRRCPTSRMLLVACPNRRSTTALSCARCVHSDCTSSTQSVGSTRTSTTSRYVVYFNLAMSDKCIYSTGVSATLPSITIFHLVSSHATLAAGCTPSRRPHSSRLPRSKRHSSCLHLNIVAPPNRSACATNASASPQQDAASANA